MKLFSITVLALIAIANGERGPILRAAPLPLPESMRDKWNQAERIVGGSDVPDKGRPFQVMMLYQGSFRCGGSWVSEQCVLTAAHCVDGIEANTAQITIRANTLSASDSRYDVGVSRVIRHPNYNSATIDYDYAVIQTSSSRPAGDNSGVVGLVGSDFAQPAGKVATVSGWGRTVGGGAVSETLKWVKMNTITNADCKSRMGIFSPAITDRMCCAGPETGISACNGDSGGPLTDDETGLQYGVVSWGQNDCSRAPTVYGCVPNQIEWIKTNCGLN